MANRGLGLFLLVSGLVLGWSDPVFATTVSTVSQNIVTSASTLPGFLSGGCYMLALVLGASGIIKLKQHVEDGRTPLRESVMRFLGGGALLALPFILVTMRTAIDGGGIMAGNAVLNQIEANNATQLGIAGANAGSTNINLIFANVIRSIQDVPGLFAGAAYMLGLLFAVSGILQLKDHVLNPDTVPLRSSMTRLIAGGTMFALPVLFEAMWVTLGAGSNNAILNGVKETLGTSVEGGNGCTGGAGAASVGQVMCNLYRSTNAFPNFIAAFCYMAGIALGMWGVLRIKEHIIDPSRTPMWDGIARLIVGGALFAIPTILDAVFNSMATALGNHANSGFSDGGATNGGLDKMLVDFMTSIFGPLNVLLTFFGYIAGIVLVIIGVMRLMKTTQEGVRGPGGIGTIMTFIAGGALLSFSPMMAAFTNSLFGDSNTATIGVLNYTVGLGGGELGHIQAVIASILKFVLVLGLISFLRGIFIVRDVAEGDQQASMMSGVTHLIGGALAVNLGPFLGAVQSTLGLTDFGVTFS